MYNAGLCSSYHDAHCGDQFGLKTLTESVAVAYLDIEHGTKAGQGTWKCSLPAEFVDAEQMSVLELKALNRMPHTTIDGHHHN